MANPLFNAKIISTGKVIQVYKHYTGDYVDYADCGTMYQPNELELEKPKK